MRVGGDEVLGEGSLLMLIFGMLLLIVLVLTSIGFVEPVNYGLMCNRITK